MPLKPLRKLPLIAQGKSRDIVLEESSKYNHQLAEDDIEVVMSEKGVTNTLLRDAQSTTIMESKKRKFHHLTVEEDPMRYHARPRDLLSIGLNGPECVVDQHKGLSQPKKSKRTTLAADVATADESIAKVSPKVFSSALFSSLSINDLLSKHIQSPLSEGGLGMTQSTIVQSASIPVLISGNHLNVVIKSQTGSGKTLAYLIPIVDHLMQLTPKIQRSDGTRALIIAPTRELCSQIQSVASKLVQCCVWIVVGCLSGGEKKKSEKTRLRKGISVLVSTPGRLLDHLKTTESFSLIALKWLVLDEADRLLDMGFEKPVLEIFSLLHGTSATPAKADQSLSKRWSSEKSRAMKKSSKSHDICHIFASATLTPAVTSQLAGPVLIPISDHRSLTIIDADKEKIQTINAIDAIQSCQDIDSKKIERSEADESSMNNRNRLLLLPKDEIVEAPVQLAQYFMIVTCKWRLAALMSFLKTHSSQKVIVFFSTCDAVDYHGLLMRESQWPLELDPANETDETTPKMIAASNVAHSLDALPIRFTGLFGDSCHVYRLHGNMPQHTRHEVFESFSSSSQGVLLCTDVAARGLDLPKVDWILQYDPPCETTDYIHRIGRTARKGLVGSALIFLLPSEAGYINLLQSHSLHPRALSLMSLFSQASQVIPGSSKFKNIDEMTAVIIQRRLEKTVYSNEYMVSAAKQCFRSFTRAYATHSSDTKAIFKVSSLHLGHVAKSFALRDSPLAVKQIDDVIGRIMNGEFSVSAIAAAEKSAEQNRLSRKERKQHRDEKYSLSSQMRAKKKNMKSSNKKQKIRSNLSKPPAIPSGRFRKSGGYFKKKMRSQSASEFSQG